MKQLFNKSSHKKFINYYNIKNNPSKIEINYYEKTKKYLKYIKWIPGLKMVGIGNSISMNCASKNSDIDLLIVTTPNSMWLNRILITLIFQILLVRKTPKKHAERFCLSFFATTKGLDFSNWKIKNDIYLYFWIIYFKPILDFDNTYNLFIKKNSNWADFNQYNKIIEDNKSYIKYTKNNNNQNKKDPKAVVFFNKLFKKIFLPKTIKHYNSIGKPYGIIINNNLLKFHDGDIRKKIKDILIK